jgi:hypothetical protein
VARSGARIGRAPLRAPGPARHRLLARQRKTRHLLFAQTVFCVGAIDWHAEISYRCSPEAVSAGMESTSVLVWAMVFGAIGLGFFVYGKRQRAAVPFAVGVALFVFPYFVSNVYIMVTVGAVLVALPYFVRL